MNNVRTLVLLAGLVSLCVLAGQLIGGSQGLVLGLALGGPVSFGSYFFSDRVVLGAGIMGRPTPLVNALRRLDRLSREIPMNISPAAATLAQVNPLVAYGGGMTSLLNTHPPTDVRVQRLEAMVGLAA